MKVLEQIESKIPKVQNLATKFSLLFTHLDRFEKYDLTKWNHSNNKTEFDKSMYTWKDKDDKVDKSEYFTSNDQTTTKDFFCKILKNK